MCVIIENSSARTRPEVEAWLAEQPRMKFHLMPRVRGSSMVEALFGILTRRSFKQISFPRESAPRRYLEDFLADWNGMSTPFVWRKPAPTIIQLHSGMIARTSRTEHQVENVGRLLSKSGSHLLTERRIFRDTSLSMLRNGPPQSGGPMRLAMVWVSVLVLLGTTGLSCGSTQKTTDERRVKDPAGAWNFQLPTTLEVPAVAAPRPVSTSDGPEERIQVGIAARGAKGPAFYMQIWKSAQPFPAFVEAVLRDIGTDSPAWSGPVRSISLSGHDSVIIERLSANDEMAWVLAEKGVFFFHVEVSQNRLPEALEALPVVIKSFEAH